MSGGNFGLFDLLPLHLTAEFPFSLVSQRKCLGEITFRCVPRERKGIHQHIRHVAEGMRRKHRRVLPAELPLPFQHAAEQVLLLRECFRKY